MTTVCDRRFARVARAGFATRAARAAAAVGAVAAALAVSSGAARAAEPLRPLFAGTADRPAGGAGDWQVALGFRSALFRDAGFDPFSGADVLPQVSVFVSRAFRGEGPFVPAIGIAGDTGGSSARARGTDAAIGISKVSLLIEGRLVVARGIELYGRLAPGLQHTAASLSDPSAPATLSTGFTTPSLDASAGAAVPLASINSWSVWFLADGGYGYAPRHDLALRPELPASAASNGGETSLGSLASRGPFFRVSLALSH